MKANRLIKIRKLPVYLGIAVPIFVLAFGILLINQARIIQSSASADKQPTQVRVTNITDQSVVVSWITNEPASGAVQYGTEKNILNFTAMDIRDKTPNSLANSKTHYVLVDNLQANSLVYYQIISSGVVFTDSGQPYQVKTSTKAIPADSDIAQGRILNADNSPAADALVYLTLANTVPQVAICDKEGHWMVPLSTARASSLNAISNYDRNSQVVDLVAIDGTNRAGAIVSTKNDNPTPDIVLGNDYNFVSQKATNAGNDNTVGNTPSIFPTKTSATPTMANTGQGDSTLSIIYPANSNEKVTSSLPEFIGIGPAGEKLEIVVHSDQEIKANTTVGNDKSWRWSPTTPLSPGEHTVTVSYTDKDGFVKKVSKSFIVTAAQAAENDFLPSFTATQSGQQATPTPTPTQTPRITAQPTATPTRPIQKATQTPSPTITPAERMTIPENQGDVPTSGNSITTIAIGGIGLVIVIAGLAFLIF